MKDSNTILLSLSSYNLNELPNDRSLMPLTNLITTSILLVLGVCLHMGYPGNSLSPFFPRVLPSLGVGLIHYWGLTPMGRYTHISIEHVEGLCIFIYARFVIVCIDR